MINADQVISIESAGPKARARRITFASGDTLILPNVVLKALGIQLGQESTPADIRGAAAEIATDFARERAMAIVGYRERSSTELRKTLLDQGFECGTVDDIVARFVELALVDDQRFAGMYARSRLASGRGTRLVLRELADKGVDAETAAHAVECASELDEVTRARRVIHDTVPVDRKERERLLRRLLARGFDMTTALSALGSSSDQQ